jgi:hypothetical protein
MRNRTMGAGGVGPHVAARAADGPRKIDGRSGIGAGLAGRRGVAADAHALADPLAPFADQPPSRAAARGGDLCYSAP